VQEVDPDILAGFDIVGRDLRLLLDRFRVLKLGPLRLGRTAQEYTVTASTNYRCVVVVVLCHKPTGSAMCPFFS
jgi:hypothetical protein